MSVVSKSLSAKKMSLLSPVVRWRLAGPWKGVSAEGRARRGLSVIQNFKNRCHVIWGYRESVKMGSRRGKIGGFCGKSFNFLVFRGF